MAKPKKKDDKPKGINFVRGGAICDASGSGGGAIIKGSRQAAICRTSAPKSGSRSKGTDTRPRWRAAGK